MEMALRGSALYNPFGVTFLLPPCVLMRCLYGKYENSFVRQRLLVPGAARQQRQIRDPARSEPVSRRRAPGLSIEQSRGPGHFHLLRHRLLMILLCECET